MRKGDFFECYDNPCSPQQSLHAEGGLQCLQWPTPWGIQNQAEGTQAFAAQMVTGTTTHG